MTKIFPEPNRLAIACARQANVAAEAVASEEMMAQALGTCVPALKQSAAMIRALHHMIPNNDHPDQIKSIRDAFLAELTAVTVT